MVNVDTIKENLRSATLNIHSASLNAHSTSLERRFNVAEYKRSLGLILFSAIPLLSKDRYLYI